MTTEQLTINKSDAPISLPSLKCASPDCRANAMKDGSGFCYWHNPNIDEAEKQRNRALGGRNSRPVEVWAIPDEIQEIETLLDIKKAYNSLFRWLLEGFISPSQAIAARQLLAGFRECLIDNEIEQMLQYKSRLQHLLGDGNDGDEWQA